MGTDIHVNRLIEELLPKAIKLESVQAATKDDPKLKKLLHCLKTRDKGYCKKNLPRGTLEFLTSYRKSMV